MSSFYLGLLLGGPVWFAAFGLLMVVMLAIGSRTARQERGHRNASTIH